MAGLPKIKSGRRPEHVNPVSVGCLLKNWTLLETALFLYVIWNNFLLHKVVFQNSIRWKSL